MAAKCADCGYNTKKTVNSFRERRRLTGEDWKWHRDYLNSLRKPWPVTEESVICCKCRRRLGRIQDGSRKAENEQTSNSQNDHPSTIRKLPSTHSRCCICGALVTSGMCVIPPNARMDLLVSHQYFIAKDSRICSKHLNGQNLIPDLDITATQRQLQSMSSNDTADCLETLLTVVQESQNKPYLDFDNNDLNDDDFRIWKGWSKKDFEMMESYMTNLRATTNRSIRSALAMFWVKLKTGLSDNELVVLFNLDRDNGRKYVSEAIHSVAAELDLNFVPQYLGVTSLSREDALNHNTVFSSTLFGNRVTTIWDGTYFYIEKCEDHEMARRTYSGHKHRPLVKFMSVVFPDGYVLETIGPYMSDGRNNDAGMTKHIFSTHSDLLSWMEDDDLAILDRGFRDVIDIMEEQGLHCQMPSYLGKGVSQHTVKEANESRLITKVRWVVESYHGRLKKWVFFDKRISNKHIPYLNKYVRITTAALNAFRPPIKTDSPEDEAMASDMVQRASIRTNHVFEHVEKGALSSRGGNWIPMQADGLLPDFPELSMEYLYHLTLGTYQLRQASRYTDEHFHKDGDYEVHIHSDASDLIRAWIQSRHVGSKKYFLWIEFALDEEDPITGWYCQCKPGQRVVGCCAHVASVLWFLGVARHDGYCPRKRSRLLLNAATI